MTLSIRTTTCAVCARHISPLYLMCDEHWAMVPRQLQAEVLASWRAYRSGSWRLPAAEAQAVLQRYDTARATATATVRELIA